MWTPFRISVGAASAAALLLMSIAHNEAKAADTIIPPGSTTSDNLVLLDDDTVTINGTLDNDTGSAGPTIRISGVGTFIDIDVNGILESVVDAEAVVESDVGQYADINNYGVMRNLGGRVLKLDDDTYVFNYGSIVAGNGANAIEGEDYGVLINYLGSTITTDGGDAFVAGDETYAENNGTITVSAGSGRGLAVVGEDSELKNTGEIHTVDGHAMEIGDWSDASNTGTIDVTGTGSGIVGGDSNYTLINEGTITVINGDGIRGGNDNQEVANTSTGTIDVTGTGSGIVLGDEAAYVHNDGEINVINGDGIHIGDDLQIVYNTGTINVTGTGDGIDVGESFTIIYNTGTINTINGKGVRGDILGSALYNYGSIHATGTGAAVTLAFGYDHGGGDLSYFLNETDADITANLGNALEVGSLWQIDNNSTITSTSGNGVVTTGFGGILNNTGTISAVGGIGVKGSRDGTITNTGTIIAGGDGIQVNVDADCGCVSSETIDTTGTITSGGIAINILGSVSNDVVNISGTVTGATGAVFTGNGDDVVTLNRATITGYIDGGTGNDTLNIDQSAADDLTTINGDVRGFTDINLKGGITDFQGGVQAKSLDVASGARLVGTGTYDADVTNAGTIAPGHSIGTLTIGGDYIHASTGVLEIELDGTGASDMLDVSDDVRLNGGTIKVIPSSLTRVVGTLDYTIIRADGSLTGTFDTVDAPTSLLLTFEDIYTSGVSLGQESTDSLVQLRLSRTALRDVVEDRLDGFADAIEEHRATSYAELFDVLEYIDTLATADEIETLLRRLDGVQTLDLSQITLDLAQAVRSALSARLHGDAIAMRDRQVLADRPQTAGDLAVGATNGVWGTAFGSTGTRDEDGSRPGYDSDTYGLAFGVDRRFTDVLTLGLNGNVSQTDVSWSDGATEADIQSLGLGAYGSYDMGAWYVDGSLVAGYQQYETKRQVLNLGTAEGEHEGYLATTQIGGGYRADVAGLRVTPIGAVQYSYLNESAYTETGDGGNLKLHVDSHDTSSLQSILGVVLAYPLDHQGLRVTPEVRAEWKHEFIDDALSSNANLVGGNLSYRMEGKTPVSDAYVVGAGVTASLTDDLSVYLNYTATLSDEYEAQTVSGGLRYDF